MSGAGAAAHENVGVQKRLQSRSRVGCSTRNGKESTWLAAINVYSIQRPQYPGEGRLA